MNKQTKYNQTQLLECIGKLQHKSFVKEHEEVLNLLVALQNEGVVLNSKTILTQDVDLFEKLEQYIQESFTKDSRSENPILDITKASDAKLNLNKVTPTVSCATDKDFF